MRAQAYGRGLTSIAESFANDPMFGKDAAGNPIQRVRQCECDGTFTQTQLSEWWMEWVGRVATNGERAQGMIAHQIPGLYVPVHCPKCERVDIERQARIDMQDHWNKP